MSRLLGIVILTFSLACFTLAYAADHGVTTETTTDAQGQTLVRSVTPGNPGMIQDPAPPQNPLDVGTIWEADDPTAIANNVDISGNGQTIVTGWYLNNKRTTRYATMGTGSPVWDFYENANFYIPVSSSDDGNVIASCGMSVPLNVWLNGASTPSWSYTAPDSYNWSDVDVSDNGTYVVAVCKWNANNPASKLFVFNSGSSTPVWQADFSATNGINGVEISENNGWVVVSGYSNFFVYDNTAHTLFYTGPNYSQTVCGIDDDAEYLAEGDFYGTLHLYRRIGSAYVQQWQNTLGGWVTAVDISSDASTVIAGNFGYSPSFSGMVRGFGIDGTIHFTYNQYGDYVSSVALSSNGSVGVAGSWGQLNGAFGDVFTAFNMSNGSVIYHILSGTEEPGSIFAVAISDNGSYATAGGKAVHARTFGNGGETYSIDLTTDSPGLDVSMTPVNPPIVIPAQGGSFSLNATVQRTQPPQSPFNVWSRDRFPDGTYSSILLGPVQINPPVGQAVTRLRVQNVPGTWPAGVHYYIGYANPTVAYPAADADSFPWTKSTTADGGPLVWDSNCYGELFPGEQSPSALLPSGLDLKVSPSPFNPTTTISFNLPETQTVTLNVYDVSGKLVATLVNGRQEAGTHSVTFDGSKLSSGVYLYTLMAGQNQATGKMVLLK